MTTILVDVNNLRAKNEKFFYFFKDARIKLFNEGEYSTLQPMEFNYELHSRIAHKMGGELHTMMVNHVSPNIVDANSIVEINEEAFTMFLLSL